MSDKKDQRDYNRGYRDGRSDRDYPIPSVQDIVVGAVAPGVDPAGPSSNYNDGYRDGQDDRSSGK